MKALAKKKAKQNINKLTWKGRSSTNEEEMISFGKEFYKELFSEKQSDPAAREELRAHIKLKLSNTSKAKLDKPISAEEAHKALKTMQNGKSPGLDSLPTEVYKAIPELVDGALEMWNHTLQTGELSTMAITGKLVIIHKKGNKEDLKNYRPLTLMNTDYKIIAKVLANRLKESIREVVGSHQTGFIKGRNIKYNVVEAYLAIKHRSRNSANAIILLDFKKAYNRVN